jgi:hypothetical protein
MINRPPANKQPKQKKCKVCKTLFQPINSLQIVCCGKCGIEYVNREKKKDFTAKTKKMRLELMTYSDRKGKALDAVKRFVRARDRWRFISQGKPPECISCGTTNPDIQYAAGHYKTAGGNPELALDPKNIHLQCNHRCNKMMSGNISGDKTTRGYTAGIIEWYGEEEGRALIDYLTGHHEVRKYSHDELDTIRIEHNRLALELEKKIKAA